MLRIFGGFCLESPAWDGYLTEGTTSAGPINRQADFSIYYNMWADMHLRRCQICDQGALQSGNDTFIP